MHIYVYRLIEYLPNCIAIIVFQGLGRERFLSFGQIHPSQLPAYLTHTSTASLPTIIPTRFLTTTVYSRLGLPIL